MQKIENITVHENDGAFHPIEQSTNVDVGHDTNESNRPSEGNENDEGPPATSTAPITMPMAPHADMRDFENFDLDYVETQSIGLESSGGIFWICNAFTMYGRQTDASASGLILLLGHGLQFVWALNTMRRYRDMGGEATILGKAAILIYYMGAIFGSVSGAWCVGLIRKKTIYVSVKTVRLCISSE